ncbi:hypothetical protein VTH06DRAFT_4589 [Thermothelomyces fergusii]
MSPFFVLFCFDFFFFFARLWTHPEVVGLQRVSTTGLSPGTRFTMFLRASEMTGTPRLIFQVWLRDPRSDYILEEEGVVFFFLACDALSGDNVLVSRKLRFSTALEIAADPFPPFIHADTAEIRLWIRLALRFLQSFTRSQ